MGKIYDKAVKKKLQKFYDEYLDALPELLERLKAVDEENTEGREEIEKLIKNKLDVASEKLNEYVRIPDGNGWNFEKEREEAIFAENETITLKPLKEEYYDLYLKTRACYADPKFCTFTDPEYREVYLKQITENNTFFVAITRKSDSAYLGYIGLKDTSANLWEFCVELLPGYCNVGYGYDAVKLFLKRVSEVTGNENQQFMALVEVDNIPSQKLMLKLGGRLIDIYDYTFHDEALAESFEEEHLGEITEHMIELAEELMVEPRKLLSHVLDYRIFADKL